MLKKMTLRMKLLCLFLLVGILPFAVIAGLAYWRSSNALEEQAFNQLNSLRDAKSQEVESFFEKTHNDVKLITETAGTLLNQSVSKLKAVQALKKTEIESYFNRAKEDVHMIASSGDVQKAFDALKTYHDEMKTGADENLNISTGEYKKIHHEVGPFLDQYVKTYGYNDIFLICAKHGHVIYTQSQGSDQGENVNVGKYKDEGLARIWKKVVATNAYAIEDFSPRWLHRSPR